MNHPEPKNALRFYDLRSRRELLYNYDNGWLYYRHPDGQWVTLREATDDDRRRLNQAVVEAHHSERVDP